MARPRSSVLVSRERVFAAAAAEFAARGYAGPNVDRIARAARLNKAMIYYHFKSKDALYREILRDMFGAVRTRVEAVAASNASAEDKLRAYVAAIADEAEARPHFPPIWLREIAEGAGHVDASTSGHPRRPPRSAGSTRRGPPRPLPARPAPAGAGRDHRAAHVLPRDRAAPQEDRARRRRRHPRPLPRYGRRAHSTPDSRSTGRKDRMRRPTVFLTKVTKITKPTKTLCDLRGLRGLSDMLWAVFLGGAPRRIL